MLDLERDHGRMRNYQMFMEMSNQIIELTSIIEALANQIIFASSNKDRNTLPNREETTHDAIDRDTLGDSDSNCSQDTVDNISQICLKKHA